MAFPTRPSAATTTAAIAVAAAFAALGVALSNGSPAVTPNRGTVEVTATATVVARPDTLTVDLAVRDVASSSAVALNRNNRQMTTLQQVFRHAGVPAKELATSNLSVGQNYDSNGKPDGFVAEDDLTVTLTDLRRAGAVLSTAQSAVGNAVSIESTTYSLANSDAPLDAARANAVHHARAAAAALAGAAGERLGGIVRITDQTNTTTPLPFNSAVASPQKAAASVPVPLQPGTQSVTASEAVVFSVS